MEQNKLLARYANLLVVHGLNLQPGQIVNLAGEACHRELLYLVAQEAYKRGVAYVNIDLIEPRLQRLRVNSSTNDQMKYVPSHLTVKYRELVDQAGANLRIVGPEDPDLLKGLDPQKVNTGRLANYQAAKYFYEEGIGKSKVHWLVAAGATPGWGKRIFKDATSEEAQRLLWEQIFKICRVDREDYLEEWKRHNNLLHQRAARLSDLRIDRIHFTGPGTDLTVGLSEKAVFKAGGDMGPRGVEFEPNIPSEECFSSPDWRRTEGYVRTTRPFFINGVLIKGLSLKFTHGEIVEFEAIEGKETFKEYISSDEGGKRLGEVALVGIDSPIYQSGHVFEEILFDENAACHIAVGSAYKFCISGAESMNKEDFAQIGCNESSVHTDMMISSEEVDVSAITRDGSRLVIIEKGKWKDF